jgi:hypothetical protein
MFKRVCVCLFLSQYVCECVFVRVFVCVCVQFVCLCVSVCLSVCVSVCLSVRLPACLSVCLFVQRVRRSTSQDCAYSFDICLRLVIWYTNVNVLSMSALHYDQTHSQTERFGGD